MDTIASLLKGLKRRHRWGDVRCWNGPTPEGRQAALPRLIAAKVGYPTSSFHIFEKKLLRKIVRAEATMLLAFLALNSLAYPKRGYSSGLQETAEEALNMMSASAEFYTNTDRLAPTRSPGSYSGVPLSAATFDEGVIGFDQQRAFIFWVEDED